MPRRMSLVSGIDDVGKRHEVFGVTVRAHHRLLIFQSGQCVLRDAPLVTQVQRSSGGHVRNIVVPFLRLASEAEYVPWSFGRVAAEIECVRAPGQPCSGYTGDPLPHVCVFEGRDEEMAEGSENRAKNGMCSTQNESIIHAALSP